MSLNLIKKLKSTDISKYYPLFFTFLLVLIISQYTFSALEAVFYDLRIKFDFGISYKDNIVIITQDEVSDEFLGETYPYTYSTHTRMLKKLLIDKPLVINYFSQLLEPFSDEDKRRLGALKDEVKKFVNGGGYFRFATTMDPLGERLPPKDLRELGYSLALVNVDNSLFAKDDVSRRAILNISGEDTLYLWTANVYRVLTGENKLQVSDILGSYYVREADATFTMFRYYTSPLENNGRIRTIPFHRVLVGNFPKGFFENKVVLIGPKYVSNSDNYVLTPFNKEDFKTPTLNLHSQIIQSLIQNKTVYPLGRRVTNVLSWIIAIVLSLIISKFRPTRGLFITVALMLGIIVISYLIFVVMGVWLYVTHLILTIFIVYYIWVPFRAIGEYQRRYAIQEETKLLKQVENLKQNFISLMSHDLKTPVAKIAGLVDVLIQKNRENTPLISELKKITDSTKELNKFITSILDLTKVESRKIALNPTSKDVNQIIETVVKELNYESSQKSIEIEQELGPLYPVQVDINLMKRVLSNLVENAIKYSPEGSRIKVKTWDNENWVYIEIADNGSGIPEEDCKHIFDKFFRVKNDSIHKVKGTGLGLYLVKYFVELHGGTITVHSVMGEGSTFTIKLKNE